MSSNDVKIPKARNSIIYKPKSTNPTPNAHPVNKSLPKLIEKKAILRQKKAKSLKEKDHQNNASKELNNSDNNQVTIITCTNRANYIKNVFENYSRQINVNKELIIILNSDHLDLIQWQEEAKKYKNIRVYKVQQSFTLGKCLNYAISISKYKIIAKFDDDDYYGPKYLEEAINAFKTTGARVLGKGATYVYFVSQKTLAIRTPNQENRYVNFVNGSTLIFRKDVCEKVKFVNRNIAEDVMFCRDCIQKGFKIYSTSKFNHVYIRHPIKQNHTWKISDNDFLEKFCTVVAKTNDYISYANQ